MCSFHGRALLVARSIYAARAAMTGRAPSWPPPPAAGPDPYCPEVRRFFAEGGPPPETEPRSIGFGPRCTAVDDAGAADPPPNPAGSSDA